MSTRKQILLHLKKIGPQTVEQLANRLEISPMGVRQHLAALEKDGLLAHKQLRHHIGRPSYLFSLTDSAEDIFPKSYDIFAEELLASIEESEGDARLQRLFELRAAKQYESRKRSMGQPTLSGRLRALCRILDDEGYLPEIDSKSPELRLCLHNCSIIKIAQRYPRACETEASSCAKLLGAQIVVESSQAYGDFDCRFRIDSLDGDQGPH